MQRLFTTFANGLPGLGLLVQRLIISLNLLYRATVILNGFHTTAQMAPHIAAAILGLFIMVGFWTPIAGGFLAVVGLWIALASGSNAWMSIVFALLGGTLAIIGPGAWSIDARLYGRKRIPAA